MQPKQVLIVDDEDDIREVAGASLELTHGWTILTASNGKEAVDVATRTPLDAILLDVMMPDIDGPTAFGLLRADERSRHIPVILLTAKVQSTDRQRYLQLGVQGVIAKPFDPLQLGHAVAAILQW